MKDIKIDYDKLYDKYDCFRLYVDRCCNTYGYTKKQAFKDKIIQSYADYILTDEPEEVLNEVRANYGC